MPLNDLRMPLKSLRMPLKVLRMPLKNLRTFLKHLRMSFLSLFYSAFSSAAKELIKTFETFAENTPFFAKS